MVHVLKSFSAQSKKINSLSNDLRIKRKLYMQIQRTDPSPLPKQQILESSKLKEWQATILNCNEDGLQIIEMDRKH